MTAPFPDDEEFLEGKQFFDPLGNDEKEKVWLELYKETYFYIDFGKTI